MREQIQAGPLFSVEQFSTLNFDGPQYDGFAVVRREAGLPPKIMGVYVSGVRAEAAAERLRDETRGTNGRSTILDTRSTKLGDLYSIVTH
jgi:hypothetical protein